MEGTTANETCAQCSKTLSASDRIVAGDRVFCRACYETLRMHLQVALENTSRDVNYPMAVLGALLGGAAGVLVWWGFTVVTKIAFGLVAVVIGFLVANGAVRFAGHKRTAGLQVLSVVVCLVSFAVATYLVNMTFINRQLAQQGQSWRLSFPPDDLGQFVAVVRASFGFMDVVFLAIVLWEGWRIPKPLRLEVAPPA
jgi:hypothetical protein